MIADHGRAFFAFICVLFFAMAAVVAVFIEAAVLPELDIEFILKAGGMVMTAGSVFIAGERLRDAAVAWKSPAQSQVGVSAPPGTKVTVDTGEQKPEDETGEL